MKIGIDISQTCESKSGTGFFADQVVRSLAEIDDKNQYTLLPWFYDYRPKTIGEATKINKPNFTEKVIKKFNDTEKTLAELDIIHSNNFRFPGNTSAKKVVTIYDVSFLDNPEFTTESNRIFCYKGTLDSVLCADKIIAISEYTKQRILHFFPFINQDKVEVVYCGNRESLLTEKENPHILKQYGIKEKDYYLSVGTIEPRKNYDTLLEAYSNYKKQQSKYKKLCIAGGYGWLEENFKEKIKKLDLENDVVITGYVSEEELANLYRYSFAFIYPTWYEGFGLPVLEAMNFQIPVIASSVTSIPEILGDEGMLIDPKYANEIVEYMKQLEEEENFHCKIVKYQNDRLKKFSWKESAKKLLKLYNILHNEKMCK